MVTSHMKELKIFYCYAHEDQKFRKKLEQHLSNLKRLYHLTTWFDRDILPGENWEAVIDGHLLTADVIFLLISPAFMDSTYCYEHEMQRALERHAKGEAAVIPILARPVHWKGAPFSMLQMLPTNARPVASWTNPDEAFAHVVSEVERVIAHLLPTHATAEAHTNDLPPLWNIPYPRNGLFTGREELLAALHDHLSTHHHTIALTQAISGLGGIGKTQTAVEYAYRHRDDYTALFWLRAETEALCLADLAALAHESLLNLPQKEEQSLVLKEVLHWLETHAGWLLILDNVEDLQMVQSTILQPLAFALNQDAGHVLLTTRIQATGPYIHSTRVETLSIEQGTAFLLHRAKRSTPGEKERRFARAICEAMGGLPLALDQAGAFIEETGCSFAQYLTQYRERTKRSTLLKRRGTTSSDHLPSVNATFALAFEEVQRQDTTAATILRVCALLYPGDIPERLIVEGIALLGRAEDPLPSHLPEMDEAFAVLQRYSLVQRNPETQTLTVHRVVQAILQDTMLAEQQRYYTAHVIQALAIAFPESDYTTWTQCEQYLPHVLACQTLIGQWDIQTEEASSLLYRAAQYLQDRAQYTQAELLYQQALSIEQKTLGPEHPSTGNTLHALATLYQDQGRYPEAEPLYQQALSISQKTLGPEHPSTKLARKNYHNFRKMLEQRKE